ncbi:MAG: glycosyltransferase [Bacteroidales bacterium]|nr:glycosyltransferase [Bacteroidales bacterium]
MNIFLLSSVYPSQYTPQGTTPVVHYFTKEWVSEGHKVHVFHTESCFPKAFYFFGRPFKKILDSKLGHLVPSQAPKEYDDAKDGVSITHISLKKIKPHGRFSKKQIQRAFRIISSYIEKEGVPDCFVGHWDNPQLELLHALKEKYHRRTCLVYHSNQFSQLYNCYGKDTDSLVKDIDLVGFRNITAQANYEERFGKPKHSFIAASGVSRPFIEAGRNDEKTINEVKSFVYVGGLINRKYPSTVITALSQVYQKDPFEIIYIGEGDDKKQIQQRFDELGCNGKLTFTGRIPREDVVQYLKQSDVFVMISKGEIFGLVYLEAMALGCITIAARHEGIDGIIEDVVNGFLCEAGNSDELASIISKIRNTSPDELKTISHKAKETAQAYSDVNVAKNYIDELSKIVS